LHVKEDAFLRGSMHVVFQSRALPSQAKKREEKKGKILEWSATVGTKAGGAYGGPARD